MSMAEELVFASARDESRGLGFACVAGSLHMYESVVVVEKRQCALDPFVLYGGLMSHRAGDLSLLFGL